MVFDSGDEIDAVSFDPGKISDARLRELMLLSPHLVAYMRLLPEKDLEAVGSIEGTVVNKGFVAFNIELCVPEDSRYAHCDAHDVGGENLLRNAKINLQRSKRGLAWLQNLNAPAELQPVKRFLVATLSFSVWMEETKYKYLASWDDKVLKETREGFEPGQTCVDTFRKLGAATSDAEKYEIVRHDWGNCANAVMWKKLGNYPVASWETFLRAYGITENFKEIGPPD